MKTLIVHPDDRTTDFLKPIYQRLSNTTILTGGSYSSAEMNQLIDNHDQVIMLGHGWEHGLLSRGVFTHGGYIIDEANVEALKRKSNSVFIWCYAEEFVARNQLKGICTGMFISEPLEAIMHKVDYVDSDIDFSNELFSRLLGDSLVQSRCVQEAYYSVFRGYTCPANNNHVLAYNAERWCYHF